MPDTTVCKEIVLTECGREKCVPQKNVCSRPKDFHLFHCVLQGRGFAEIGGKRYNLNKGDVFYIKSNTSANYAPDPSDPWTYIWVGFDGLIADELLNKCGVSVESPVIRDSSDGELRKIFQALYDRYNGAGEFGLTCLGLFYVLLGAVERNMTGRADIAAASQKDRHIKEACEYIANNFQFPITVVDIASSVGLSPNYLANIFAERLDSSPKQYLTQYRIEKACSYLKLSDMPIREIAKEVGYGNQLHFSAAFSKAMNVSPSEYRKAKRSENR